VESSVSCGFLDVHLFHPKMTEEGGMKRERKRGSSTNDNRLAA
jgi:hypothetical protein